MTELREGTAQAAGMRSEQIELIRQRGDEWIRQGNTEALVLLAARRGVICLHEAWGELPGRAGVPVQRDSVFLLASFAKPVLAAVAMRLVEEGRLGLTRPVQHYVPELCGAGAEEILVQHLLTHTAGIIDEQVDALVAQRWREVDLPSCPPDQHWYIHRLLHALYPLEPDGKPGEAMRYSQNGYVLLGEVVRRVAGGPVAETMRAYVFDPLGMNDTSLGFDPAIERRLAVDVEHPHSDLYPAGDAFRKMPPMPNGVLFGTAADFARFQQMLLNGGCYGHTRVLHPATVAQMTRNQIPGVATDFFGQAHAEAGWGYGFDVTCRERWRWYDGSLKPDGCYGHAGAGGCFFWVDPANEIVGLYLSVCMDSDAETGEHHWDSELFQNLVTAAVADD